MFVVTGYDEAVEIYRDPDSFSSCNSFGGPFHQLPEVAERDDIRDYVPSYISRGVEALHLELTPANHTARG